MRPQGNIRDDAQLQLEPCSVDCRYVAFRKEGALVGVNGFGQSTRQTFLLQILFKGTDASVVVCKYRLGFDGQGKRNKLLFGKFMYTPGCG